MHYPSKKDFLKLAKSGNLIPVYREILADFETPLSAYAKIETGRYSFLLESVEGGERLARYSFMGSSPNMVFSSSGNRIEMREALRTRVFESSDPLFQWDGMYKNKKLIGEKFISNTVLAPAVFVYYMKVTLLTGEEIIRKGNISLIR